MFFGPPDDVSQHRLDHGVVFYTFEKAKQALLPATQLVGHLVLRCANGSHRFSPPPGDKELSLAAFEKSAAFGINHLGAFGEQGRHPQGIVAVDTPWEGEKCSPLASGAHGMNVKGLCQATI